MHLRANGRKLLLFFHYSINPLLLMICGVLSTMMPLWSLTSQFLHWLLGNSVWLSGQSASLRFLRSWVQSRPKTCNRRYSMENSGGHMQHFHLHGRCKHLILLSKTLLEECTYVQKAETITLLSLFYQPPSPHDMRSSLHNDASLEPNKLIPPLTFRQFSLAEWSKC